MNWLRGWVGRQNQDFLKLWFGESISLLGSQISALAIPLTAALVLQATPGQMGILNALQHAPAILISLFAGVWIDRRRRLPILIQSNLARAVILGLIPLGFYLGGLRIGHLYGIALAAGTLSILFDLAYQAYLPSLVPAGELLQSNSRLQTSLSFAQVAGPGLAGILVGWLTAPVAILMDVVTFLVSACATALIRQPEVQPVRKEAKADLWVEIADGFRIAYGNVYIRATAIGAATYNLFHMVIWSVLVLYVTQELHLGAGHLGFILSVASVGSLLGSFLATAIANRLGFGRTIVFAFLFGSTGPLLLPLASGRSFTALALLTVSFFVAEFGVAVYWVAALSLRQAFTPREALGRVGASLRFLVGGTMPLGALLGGALGSTIGLRMTLVVGAVGLLAPLCWILLSPLRHVTELPEQVEPVAMRP